MAVRGVCTGGNDAGTSTNKTQTVTLPAGCQVGDVLILVADSSTGTLTCATPSGFSLLSGPDTNSAATQRTYVFGKVLTSADITTGSFSTVWSANGTINLTTGIVFSDTGWGVLGVVVNSGQSTTIAMPSITPGEPNPDILQFVCTRNTGGVTGVAATPSGWTSQGATANGGTGTRMGCGIFTQNTGFTSAGGETVTVSPSCQITGYTIEVIPATSTEYDRTGSDTLSLSEAATEHYGASRVAAELSAPHPEGPTTQFGAVRVVSDSNIVSDSPVGVVIHGYTRTGTDTLSTSDAATRTAAETRASTDGSSLTDGVTRVIGRNRNSSDTLSVADSAGRQGRQNRTSIEALVVGDVATWLLQGVRGVTESLALTDAAARASAYLRAAADSQALTDSATQTIEVARTGQDFQSLFDTATQLRIIVAEATDPLSLSEQVGRAIVYDRIPTDDLVLADQAQSQVFVSRIGIDTLVLIEAATRVKSAQRVTAESLVLADQASGFRRANRTASETLSSSDSAAQVVVHNVFATASDTSSVTDAVLRVIALGRSGTDTHALVEALGRTSGLKRTTSDLSLLVSDNAIGLRVKPVFATDTFVLTDTLTQQTGHSRTSQETHFTVVFTVRMVAYRRTLSDALTLTDEAALMRMLQRDIAETLTTTDQASRFYQVDRSVAEALSLDDQADRGQQQIRDAADALSLVEQVDAATTFDRLIAEVAETFDQTTQQVQVVRQLVETLDFAEVLDVVGTYSRTQIEDLVLSEEVETVKAMLRLTLEAHAVVDAAIRVRHLFRTGDRIESSVTIDQPIRRLRAARSAQEALSHSDVGIRHVGHLTVLVEALGLSDVVSAGFLRTRTAIDSYRVADLAVRRAWYYRDGGDLLALSEIVVYQHQLVRTTIDIQTVSDQVSWVGGVIWIGPPVVSSLTVTAHRVGPEQTIDLQFTFNLPVEAWTVRRASSGPYDGVALIEWSGDPTTEGAGEIAGVDLVPGDNDIAVYGQSLDGRWGVKQPV